MLTALSEALDGQGEKVGRTLQTLSRYLQKMTPLAPKLVEDITLLGETAETYADVMPEIGTTLRNAVVTGNTLTARKTQLQTLFTETAAFAAAAEQLAERSGDDFITLTRDSRPTLELLANYSPTLECVLKGIDRLKPAIDGAFRDHRAHATIEFAPRSPREYRRQDAHRLPDPGSKVLSPSCATLPTTAYDAGRPSPGLSNAMLEQFGIGGDLGKTRPLVAPRSTGPAGSDLEAEQISAILATAMGVEMSEIPDVAQPLFGPVLRGAEVSLG